LVAMGGAIALDTVDGHRDNRQRLVALVSDRVPERGDLLGGQPAPGFVRPQQDVLDCARGAPGRGKAQGRADADDAVDVAVGRVDRFEDSRLAGQIGRSREGVLDLAGERRNEALPYSGETLGEWIDGDDNGPRIVKRGDLHARVNIISTAEQ
jgi:hypothetical protein